MSADVLLTVSFGAPLTTHVPVRLACCI